MFGKTNFDNFDIERLQITNKFEMDLFKEKGEKALLNYRVKAKVYSNWKHKKNAELFQSIKKIWLIVVFPHGLLHLHLKKVRQLNTVIEKKDKEIERLKLVIERKEYHKNSYKGGKIDWDDELFGDVILEDNIKDVKEA